jgi:hypothetical protein
MTEGKEQFGLKATDSPDMGRIERAARDLGLRVVALKASQEGTSYGGYWVYEYTFEPYGSGFNGNDFYLIEDENRDVELLDACEELWAERGRLFGTDKIDPYSSIGAKFLKIRNALRDRGRLGDE